MLVRNLSFVVPYFGFLVDRKRKVYLFIPPGKVGGASTRIWDLLTLLREDFELCLMLRHKRLLKYREIQEAV